MAEYGFPKPSRTDRKKSKIKRKKDIDKHESDEKIKVRKREGYRCRFVLCPCDKLDLPREVSHVRHKGMGGNPKGDRSTSDQMVLLCDHRHQFGAVSRHAGTLIGIPSTDAGYDGPVTWYASIDALAREIGGSVSTVCVPEASQPGFTVLWREQENRLPVFNSKQEWLLRRLRESMLD